jgi:hypothetical protein
MTRGLRLVFAIAIPALLFISLIAWAFASPVASSPDDDFHLPSIWCGLGERPGLCEDSGDPATRLVPVALINAPCHAFHSDITAECWAPGATDLHEAQRVNTEPLYPPIFYAAMSVFAGQDFQTSVLLMRSANALLAVAMLTGVFWALPRSLRPALVISAVAASVPLGLFIVASTNPSSWAYISAATVWISLYAAFSTEGRRQWTLAGLAAAGALVGAGARADAAAYAVLGVILACVLGLRRGVRLLAPAVSATVIVLLSAGLYLGAGQSRSAVSGLPTDNPPLSLADHIGNFVGVPGLWTGALGGWPLGWIDTDMPAIVMTFCSAVFAGAVFIGLRRIAPRRAVAVALAFAAAWLVPFILLAQSHAIVGSIVQPRYVLPLLVILLGVVSCAPAIEWWWRGPRVLVAVAALAVAQAIALLATERRYTVGTDDSPQKMLTAPEWWWVGAPAPVLVWAIGSLAFAGALVLLAVAIGRHSPAPPAEKDPGDRLSPSAATAAG